MLRLESFNGTDLMFIGEHLVGTAATVKELQAQGKVIAEHNGAAIAVQGNSFFALCDGREFKVGSTCKHGDIHYVADNHTNFLTSLASHYNQVLPCATGAVTERGLREFTEGRGEWVAQSSADALEMAVTYQKEYCNVALARAMAYSANHSNILQSYKNTHIDNAIHRLPKMISLIYEAGLVILANGDGQRLRDCGIVDGSEICIRYSASKQIGKYIAVRGQLDSYFIRKLEEVKVSTPITLTLPSDYPVFVG